MKRLYTGVITAVAIIVHLAVWTPAAHAAATPASAQPNGRIAGRITEESGRPIAGAMAEAFSCSNDTISGSALTDKDGEYAIALKSGCYRVRFAGDGHEATWYGDPGIKATAKDVDVTNDSVKGIDGALNEAGSTISGTVKSSDGKALPGAWVSATGGEPNGRRVSFSDARTDGKGSYSVRVSPGKYLITFSRTGYVGQLLGSLEQPAPVDAAEGKEVTGINATLYPGGSITGAVTNEAGTVIRGIYVVAGPDGKIALPIYAKTDAEGKFTLDGLASGKYLIAFADNDRKFEMQWYNGKTNPAEAARVTVTAPGVTPGIKAVLRQAGGIAGRVTDQAGNGLANVTVFAEPEARDGSPGFALTDDTGAYSLKGISSGSYKLSFRPAGGTHLPRYYRNSANREGADPVEVTVPQVTAGVDQVLPDGKLLRGSVRDTSGAGVPRAFISLYPKKEGVSEAAFAATENDGTFALPLPEGEYVAQITAKGYIRQWSGNRNTRSDAISVVIPKEGSPDNLDVVLSHGASISGTVRNPVGAGIGQVAVTASDATGDDNGYATTGKDGKYLIEGLKSGSYQISADGSASGYVESRLPQRVAVAAPSAVDNVDMVLAKGGSISGKVADTGGNPVGGVNVSAHDPVTWDEVGRGYTESEGHYSIGGLPEGKYRLRFEKPDSRYAIQWHKGKMKREDSDQLQITGTATLTGIDAVLSVGIPVSGTVSGAKGVPLSGAKIEVYGASEDEPFIEATSDAAGRYTISSLAPGNYRIHFSHHDYVSRWYGGSDRRTAATLTVREAAMEAVNASLMTSAGQFAGKLMNPQGQKRGEAWLTAIDAATGIAVADERICECSGVFRTPVPAGTYKLRVERHGLQTWFGGKDQEEAIPLPGTGEISGLDLVIEDEVVKSKGKK